MKRFCEVLQGLGIVFVMFWACGADSMEILTLAKGLAIGALFILAGLLGEKLTKQRHKRN